MKLDVQEKMMYGIEEHNKILYFLLFRVVEIQRIYETTATPAMEGANLSELNRTIRGFRDRCI